MGSLGLCAKAMITDWQETVDCGWEGQGLQTKP